MADSRKCLNRLFMTYMRKYYIFVSVILALISLSPLDYDQSLVLRVEQMMKQSPATRSYKYLGKGWFEFTDADGLTWRRNFGDARTQGGLKPKKIISIDIRQLDTTGYSGMFEEIASLPIGNASKPPVGSFIALDSLCEFTGQYFQQGIGDNVRLFKRIPTSFKVLATVPPTLVHSTPTTSLRHSAGDNLREL